MDILNYLDQLCTQYLNGMQAGVLNSLGMQMVYYFAFFAFIGLALREALAGASGDSSLNLNAVAHTLVMIAIVTMLETGFSTPIPGLGLSFRGLIMGSTNSIARDIGYEGLNQTHQIVNQLQSYSGSWIMKAIMNGYYANAVWDIQILLGLFQLVTDFTVAAGNLAGTVVAMFGPVFIPLWLFETWAPYFHAWLRALIALSAYKIVAAIVLSILGRLLAYYYTSLVPLTLSNLITRTPVLIELCGLCMLMCLAVPLITAIIFTGATGGHGSVSGVAAMILRFI